MKMKISIATICLITLLLSGCPSLPESVHSYDCVSPSVSTENITALSMEDLQAMSQNGVEVIIDPSSNSPKQIDGVFEEIKISNEQDAVSVLLSLRNILNIPKDTSFALVDIDDSRNEYIVYDFNQLYNGVLVESGTISVLKRKADDVFVSVYGHCVHFDDIAIEPILSAEECAESIEKNLSDKINDVCLVVFVKEDAQPRLCWRYDISSIIENDNYLIYIDTQNGDVVDKISMMIE